ncbi:MAG: GGDEF domain-containing protein [Oscillospiraceae bacterium]|nr:GGDEF domain-containing protein [Oscillospiraceae bacterium]
MADISIEELLKRIEELEKHSSSLESKFENLEEQVQTINRFISAITEAQDFEQTMTEIESVTKQLTDCEKATFYCYDNSNDKFFSHGDYRNWQEEQIADELRGAFESGEIMSDSKEAVIPLVSANGNSLGVIVAEKESGFTPDDYNNFIKGGQVVNTVELALKKEFEHQGRITDELTHLKNRQGLNEYLANTLVGNINSGRSVNILMIDIDHFKSVNDNYGHDAGDVILKGVAEVLQEATRTGADCAFRMGGEELVCILNCTPEEAVDVSERLRVKIENTIHNITHNNEPLEVKVTVSMGLHNMSPEAEMTAENARAVFDSEFKYADEAVYKAKETGRNKLICSDEKMFMSYLALKSAELLCGEDRSNIDEIKQATVKLLVDDKDIGTVVEALQTYAEEKPELAEMITELISKINETAYKIDEKQTEETEMSYESRAPKYYNKEAFKGIENKTYLNTDASTAFQIAQRATAANIEFSAKYDGEKSAVTLDGVKDRWFIEAVKSEFNVTEQSSITPERGRAAYTQENTHYGREQTQQRGPAYFGHQAEQPKQDKGATYFNREGFKDIQNKEYIRTDAKTAYTISQEAQKYGIEHSVKYDGEKSAVTIDSVKDKAFVEAVRREFNIPETTRQERPAQRETAYFGREQEQPQQEENAPTYFNREAFKNIQNKEYIRTDSTTAYMISLEAQKYGIEHSVKYDGEKSAVTVDGVKDKGFVDSVRARFNIPEYSRPAQYRSEAPNQRESAYFGREQVQPQQSKEVTYFNRDGFKDIQNKTFIQTDAKTAYIISKEASKHGIEHSAKYAGERSAVTLDGVKNKSFVQAVKSMAEWADKVQIKEAQNQNRGRNNGAR